MKEYTFYFLQLGNLYRNHLDLAQLNTVREPLKLLKEKFLSQEDTPLNLLQYVSDFQSKLLKAREGAKLNLKSTQGKMKEVLNLEIRF